MTDRLLTAAEVADDLRVSTMTVYRLIRRGELPAVRVGRNYRVRVADLETYLSSQTVDPATMDLADVDDG
jgi:excisionase family DNA binding protein